MRLRSRNSAPTFGLVLPLLLACCAGDAPALPADTTSVNRAQTVKMSDFSSGDAAMTCQDIAVERTRNVAVIDDDNRRIQASRVSNEAVLFVVPLAGAAVAKTHDQERAEIAQRYARQDQLIKLGAVKRCPD